MALLAGGDHGDVGERVAAHHVQDLLSEVDVDVVTGATERRTTYLGQEDTERVAPLGPFAAVTHDEEQTRCGRWPQELDEETRAVVVAPLQIIDMKDERAGLSYLCEEPLQCSKSAPAKLLIVLGEERSIGHDRRHRGNADEGREEPRERPDVVRDERLHFVRGKERQVMSEGVHDPVNRLVRNRFTLVTAPAQNEHVAFCAE